MIRQSYKNITAALAYYVSVAVVLFFFSACGGGNNKTVVLDSMEDSLAYSMGSLQKIQYMHFIETTCKVDSTYRAACFEGIEKGYRDTVHTIAYYDGISVGIQFMGYFDDDEKVKTDRQFIDGIIDGASNNGKDKTKLKSAEKSETYKKGLDNSHILIDYVNNQKYEGTSQKEFYEGFKEGACSFGNPEMYARACGNIFGGSRLKGALKSVNMQIYGADTPKSVPSELFYAGFMECNNPDAAIPHTKANEISIKADYFLKDSIYADNRTKGEDFLKENAKKSGIVTLPNGIQYKIIKKGNGKKPIDTDRVGIHYVGKTIEGKVFADTHEYSNPVPMDIKHANECYREVLQLMPVGSVWEIYVPQNQAFGSMQTKYLKPFSTVVYEIELINIIK